MGNQDKNQIENASDDALIAAIASCDNGALERIYKRYESLLRTVILGVVRDESEVDDVLTDVLMQILERANRLSDAKQNIDGRTENRPDSKHSYPAR